MRPVGVRVDQHVVAQQVVDLARGAHAVQVARRGGQDAARLGQPAHGQAGIRLELARADGQVDAAVHDVVVAVGCEDIDVHLGVEAGEIRQQRREVLHGKRQRRGDRQRAARLQHVGVDRGFCLLHFRQHALAAPEKLMTHIGQVKTARVALDQPRR